MDEQVGACEHSWDTLEAFQVGGDNPPTYVCQNCAGVADGIIRARLEALEALAREVVTRAGIGRCGYCHEYVTTEPHTADCLVTRARKLMQQTEA